MFLCQLLSALERISNSIDNRKSKHKVVSKVKLKIWVRENSPDKNYQIRLAIPNMVVNGGIAAGIEIDLSEQSQDTTLIKFSRMIFTRTNFKFFVSFVVIFPLFFLIILDTNDAKLITSFWGYIYFLLVMSAYHINSEQHALLKLVEDTLTEKP